jgi:hypothetical protein
MKSPGFRSETRNAYIRIARHYSLLSEIGISRPGYVALAEVTTRDLDIAILGQLPAAHLPLCDQFKSRPVQMVGFEATFRSRGLGEQRPERAAMHAHNALVLAYLDAECDAVLVGVPSRIRWKGEEHRDLPDTEDVRIMFSDQVAERNLGTRSAGFLFVVYPDSLD